jgi:hypothetical protein
MPLGSVAVVMVNAATVMVNDLVAVARVASAT